MQCEELGVYQSPSCTIRPISNSTETFHLAKGDSPLAEWSLIEPGDRAIVEFDIPISLVKLASTCTNKRIVMGDFVLTFGLYTTHRVKSAGWIQLL